MRLFSLKAPVCPAPREVQASHQLLARRVNAEATGAHLPCAEEELSL